jgi:hypothetical protein
VCWLWFNVVTAFEVAALQLRPRWILFIWCFNFQCYFLRINVFQLGKKVSLFGHFGVWGASVRDELRLDATLELHNC